MEKPIIFIDKRSPPVRSVLMLVDMLNIDADFQNVNIFTGEQFGEEFLRV